MLLFRYLCASILQASLAVTFILLLIVTSGRLAKYLTEASTGNLAADLVFWIILFRIPDFLPLLIPLGLFVGILLAYGRMYVDSESEDGYLRDGCVWDNDIDTYDSMTVEVRYNNGVLMNYSLTAPAVSPATRYFCSYYRSS